MTYREKTAWLWRYRDALRRERYLTEQVKEQRARAQTLSEALGGEPGGGGDGQGVPRAVERVLRAERALRLQVEHCEDVRAEVLATLDTAPAGPGKEILHRRYMQGQRWDDIAEAMHVDVSSVFRKHKRAVTALDIPAPAPLP